jgi:hypothetical protein
MLRVATDILSLYYYVVYELFLLFVQEAQEHKYRTGQVAYKDRRFKFI